jgi:hypothetical protein
MVGGGVLYIGLGRRAPYKPWNGKDIHTTHILHPRSLVEPEILVEPEPDIVPVQPKRVQLLVQQMLFQRSRDRRLVTSQLHLAVQGGSHLSTGTQPGEPDGSALLA